MKTEGKVLLGIGTLGVGLIFLARRRGKGGLAIDRLITVVDNTETPFDGATLTLAQIGAYLRMYALVVNSTEEDIAASVNASLIGPEGAVPVEGSSIVTVPAKDVAWAAQACRTGLEAGEWELTFEVMTDTLSDKMTAHFTIVED